jgi:DNA repair photolyase
LTTSGTKEFAEKNVNCITGCSNNCRYCYAKQMALRYKRITSEDQWKVMTENPRICSKGYCNIKFEKTQKRIMFPTSHDLKMEMWNYWFPVLLELIKSDNKILIVTKADSEVINKFTSYFACTNLGSYKKNLEFRITITGTDEGVRKFWEPGAPDYLDRLLAVKILKENHFKTSVLIEPLLTLTPLDIVTRVYDLVSEIWIGTMNHVTRSNFTSENDLKFFDQVQVTKDPKFLFNLKKQLEQFEKGKGDKIRWKDSIRQIFDKDKKKESVVIKRKPTNPLSIKPFTAEEFRAILKSEDQKITRNKKGMLDQLMRC